MRLHRSHEKIQKSKLKTIGKQSKLIYSLHGNGELQYICQNCYSEHFFFETSQFYSSLSQLKITKLMRLFFSSIPFLSRWRC